MSIRVGLVVLVAIVTVALPSNSEAQLPASSPVYVGGNVGFGFGTVDWVELSPLVGYRASDRFSLGVSGLYRWRDDGRYPGGLSTTDYGASVFGRYWLAPWAFGHLEVEYLSYEYALADLTTVRTDEINTFVGGGVAQPVGRNVALHLTVLYNLNYDSGDPFAPYDSPWVYRAGVSVGF
jgi:hypothetical protein